MFYSRGREGAQTEIEVECSLPAPSRVSFCHNTDSFIRDADDVDCRGTPVTFSGGHILRNSAISMTHRSGGTPFS